MGKLLIKKKCKKCGTKVMVQKNERGTTPAPNDCATCRTLGVKKAIEQRLMCNRKNDKTIFKVNEE